MVLDLKGVFDCEGFRRALSYDYDMSGYRDEAGGAPFQKPVSVEANLRNRAGVVELHVLAHFDYATVCDRCCAPLCEHFDLALDNVLVKDASGEGEAGDLIEVSGDSLNLDELVSSGIILSLPMKHLCRLDCKGLCPVCGKNLNAGACGCKIGSDNAFSVLKDLKF